MVHWVTVDDSAGEARQDLLENGNAMYILGYDSRSCLRDDAKRGPAIGRINHAGGHKTSDKMGSHKNL